MTTTDAQRLRGLIEAKGWGQRETERRAELPKSTLAHYLGGKTKDLKLETWRKLAAALEVPLAQLLGEEALQTHGVRLLSLEQLAPDLANPRKHFSESDLHGLAESIHRHGILQNLVARPHPERADTWQIIAGERRYIAIGELVADGRWDMNAANIPVLILERNEAETRALALLENVQRVQLSPIEEGEAYAELMALDPETWTTAAIAETVGKSQRYVQQRVSIGTGLCDEAKAALAAGEITIEQARSMATQDADIQRDRLIDGQPARAEEPEESQTAEPRPPGWVDPVPSEEGVDPEVIPACGWHVPEKPMEEPAEALDSDPLTPEDEADRLKRHAERRTLWEKENAERKRIEALIEERLSADLLTALRALLYSKFQRGQLLLPQAIKSEARRYFKANGLTDFSDDAWGFGIADKDNLEAALALFLALPSTTLCRWAAGYSGLQTARTMQLDCLEQLLAALDRPATAPTLLPPDDQPMARVRILRQRLQRHLAIRPHLGIKLFLWDLLRGRALRLPRAVETEVWPVTAEGFAAELREQGFIIEIASDGTLDAGTSDQEGLDALGILLALDNAKAQQILAGALALKSTQVSEDWTAILCKAVGAPTRVPVVDPEGEGREA